MRAFQIATQRLGTTNARKDMEENVNLNVSDWSSGNGDDFLVALVETIGNGSIFALDTMSNR